LSVLANCFLIRARSIKSALIFLAGLGRDVRTQSDYDVLAG
jgi:hypothetical protein